MENEQLSKIYPGLDGKSEKFGQNVRFWRKIREIWPKCKVDYLRLNYLNFRAKRLADDEKTQKASYMLNKHVYVFAKEIDKVP